MRVVARLVAAGRETAEVPLTYAGEPSTFAGTLPLSATGVYTLEVLAIDPANANFGMVGQTLRVTNP